MFKKHLILLYVAVPLQSERRAVRALRHMCAKLEIYLIGARHYCLVTWQMWSINSQAHCLNLYLFYYL
jgi:hypothetical protein